MRPSSSISMRLLNDELKPRALIATDVIPTCTKSSPVACLSAPTKALPGVSASWSALTRVTVAGASERRSARREADTTMASSSTLASWSCTETSVSSPGRTVTSWVWATNPARDTRRRCTPCGSPARVNWPCVLVTVPNRVPVMATEAAETAVPVGPATVPFTVPVCAAAKPGRSARAEARRSARQVWRRVPLLLMEGSPM